MNSIFFNLLAFLFCSTLFSQEINFPLSFEIDSSLLINYTLPQDDGPNPYLTEEYKDSILSIKRSYAMYFFKDYDKIKNSITVTGKEEIITILIVDQKSIEEVKEMENGAYKLDGFNDNSILLGVDRFTILIIWSKTNKNDADKIVEYYRQKIGARILAS